MGSWKSSWIVAHWWYLPIASLIFMSICKLRNACLETVFMFCFFLPSLFFSGICSTYFRAIECSISWVYFPWFSKFHQAILQLLFYFLKKEIIRNFCSISYSSFWLHSLQVSIHINHTLPSFSAHYSSIVCIQQTAEWEQCRDDHSGSGSEVYVPLSWGKRTIS